MRSDTARRSSALIFFRPRRFGPFVRRLCRKRRSSVEMAESKIFFSLYSSRRVFSTSMGEVSLMLGDFRPKFQSRSCSTLARDVRPCPLQVQMEIREEAIKRGQYQRNDYTDPDGCFPGE